LGLLALASYQIDRFVRPVASARAVARLYLAIIMGVAAGVFALLVFLTLFFAPHWVMGALGIGCAHSGICPHGYSLWAQMLLWTPPAILLIWMVCSAAWTVYSASRAGRRVRRMVLASGRPMGHVGGFPVWEVDDRAVVAFSAGVLRPLIVVSSGLRASLSPEEYEAVLAHEQGHASARDNLTLLLVRVVGRAFCFFPGLRPAVRGLRSALEIAADAYAGERTGDPLLVAGSVTRVARLALAAASSADTFAARAFASFAHDELVVERVRHLVCEQRSRSRRRVWSVVLAICLTLSVLVTGIYLVNGRNIVVHAAASECAANTEVVNLIR
jgi:Zn-dependent protease with chaperone function